MTGDEDKRTDHTFTSMERWTIQRLDDERKRLRNILSGEIQKRDAIKAEILYLQTEIKKYKIE